MPLRCKNLGAHAGSLNRNLAAHARDLGAPGDQRLLGIKLEKPKGMF